VDPAALLDPAVSAQRIAAEFDGPGDGGNRSLLAGLDFPEPFEAEPFESFGAVPARGGGGPPHGAAGAVRPADGVLPQRVPAIPDVPDSVLPAEDQLRAIADLTDPQMSHIATVLRGTDRGAVRSKLDTSDGFDMDAVVTAVRTVPGVRDAKVSWNASSGHTLRIEFRDGVDEAKVTRQVALLLRHTMGLGASRADGGGDRPLDPLTDPLESVLAEPTGRVDPLSQTGGGRRRAAVRSGDPTVRPNRPLAPARGADLPRVVVENAAVTVIGVDATVEVRLGVSRTGQRTAAATGFGKGPGVDAYLLRIAAEAAGSALDQLLVGPEGPRARCFVEHAAVVPFGGCEVAVVVLVLVHGNVTEQLCGSALVAGDPVPAVVRATLSAVNRRLESLLA
jgi:hypothetical protein